MHAAHAVIVFWYINVLDACAILQMWCAGKSLQAIWQLTCNKPCPSFGLSAWIVVFGGIQLFLSQVKHHSESLDFLMPSLHCNGYHASAASALPAAHSHCMVAGAQYCHSNAVQAAVV
jgi:hypothetical protein